MVIIGNKCCDEFKKRLNDKDFVAEEIAYAKELNKDVLPVLLDDASMPLAECLPQKISFLPTRNASRIQHEKFDSDIEELIKDIKNLREKTKNKILKKSPIIKKFNNPDIFFSKRYSETTLLFEDTSSQKHQYWQCGEDFNPDYYLIFFPASSMKKIIINFLKKIKDKNMVLPTHLTVLKDTKIQERSILKNLLSAGVEVRFLTYRDYIWKTSVPNEFKIHEENIFVPEFYIDQKLYNIEKEVEESSSVAVWNFIENENSSPIFMILAQAGVGKSSFSKKLVQSLNFKSNLQSIYISSGTFIDKYLKRRRDSFPLIESIWDLYNAFMYAHPDKEKLFLSKSILESALFSGSIIVIIDGLDEIITFFRQSINF